MLPMMAMGKPKLAKGQRGRGERRWESQLGVGCGGGGWGGGAGSGEARLD